jgi:hypothetical protein
MTAGVKANNDGSAAIQVGGSDAIQISAALNTTLVGTLNSGAITSTGAISGTTLTSTTGALYPLVSGTAWTYTSGTPASIDFTGIPSTAKRITVMIAGLSYAAGANGVLQIGSGSLTTTGYTSNAQNFSTTPGISATTQTNGFGTLSTATAASTVNGIYIITNITGNTWSFSGQIYRTTDNSSSISNGFIALGGVLDRLSLVATTSTFDAGTVNILWE